MIYDLAIGDCGLAPLLLASSILKARPGLRLAIFTRDAQPGGDCLELVLPERLAPALQDLIEPIVVRSWPGYVLRRDGQMIERAAPVWLLDPVQLQLELELLTNPPSFVGAEALTSAREVITLPAGPIRVRAAQIIGAEALAGLTVPVLADFDVASGEAAFLQYIPLGDERVAVCSVHASDDDGDDRSPEAILSARWDMVAQIAESLA